MDTSETYIKMRLAAIPYLGRGVNSPRSVGHELNWLTDSHEGVFIDTNGNFFVATKEGAVQLERQDQLQGMLGWHRNPLGYIEPLYRYITMGEELGEQMLGESMEQLWLSFYMHEKHGKKWDGERWIDA